MISLNTLVKRNDEKFLCSFVDGETVMMNTETGSYIGLNEVSTSIWKILDKEMAISNIITELLDMYEVDRATCEQDTLHAMKGMIKTNILISNEKISTES